MDAGSVRDSCATLSAFVPFYPERRELPNNSLIASFVEMRAAGIVLTPTGVLGGEWTGFSFADVTSRSLVAFVYLLVVGSLIAYSLLVWLLKNAPVSLVAAYAYANPVIALISASWCSVRTLPCGCWPSYCNCGFGCERPECRRIT